MTKFFGVGLNKTATKTLGRLLKANGYRHQSYDPDAFQLYRDGNFEALFDWMQRFDSFEDWPWPLLYKEIDQKFPDAKFVLTVRSSPEAWYRSLCKMAVRMGPLNIYEKHIYGYGMPQGRKQHHLDYYLRHNEEVEQHFANRPGKLIRVCFGNREDEQALAEFLGIEVFEGALPKLNESLPVYSGENLAIAHLARLQFQTNWKFRRIAGSIKRRLLSALRK